MTFRSILSQFTFYIWKYFAFDTYFRFGKYYKLVYICRDRNKYRNATRYTPFNNLRNVKTRAYMNKDLFCTKSFPVLSEPFYTHFYYFSFAIINYLRTRVFSTFNRNRKLLVEIDVLRHSRLNAEQLAN